MTKIIEVFGNTVVNTTTSLVRSERTVYWPGGSGRLSIQGISATGSASLLDQGFVASGSGILTLNCGELVLGITSYNSDGTWEFTAPEGFAVFRLNIPNGDSLTLGAGIFLVSI